MCEGLGWVGVGLMGAAQLRVWTHDSVAVTVRESLVPDFAKELERPGLGNQTRKPSKLVKRKKKVMMRRKTLNHIPF